LAVVPRSAVKRQRGVDRARHLSGRLVPIPYRVVERLFKGTKRDKNGCWIPKLPRLKNGYSVLYWHDRSGVDRTLTAAHGMARVIYREGEPLNEFEVPHHTCRNRACINPLHIVVLLDWDHRGVHKVLSRMSQRKAAA